MCSCKPRFTLDSSHTPLGWGFNQTLTSEEVCLCGLLDAL